MGRIVLYRRSMLDVPNPARGAIFLALALCLSVGLVGCGDPIVRVYVANQSSSAVVVGAGSATVIVEPGSTGVLPGRAGFYKTLRITVLDSTDCHALAQVDGFSGGPVLVSVQADRTVSMAVTGEKVLPLLAETVVC